MTSPAGYAAPASASPLIVRPSRRTYRANRASGAAAVALGSAVAIQAARDGLIGLAGVLVLASVAGYGVHRYMTRVRVEVSADGVLHAGLLRTRRWPWSAVGTLVIAERLTGPSRVGHEYVIVLDRRGRRLFQLTSQAWADDDRARLAGAFGTVARLRGDITPAELHALYPGALNVAQRHPLWTGVLLGLAIVAAVAVTVYLVVGPS